GSAQGIEAGIAEAHGGDGGKCQGVEPGTAVADISDDLDAWLDLVGALGGARHIERSAGSRDGERQASHECRKAIQLPAAQNGGAGSATGPGLALAEGQFPHARKRQVVEAAEGKD